LEKTLQLIREQFNLSETQFEREVIMWQEEYLNIKSMLTQMALINTNTNTNSHNRDDMVITDSNIWSNSNNNNNNNTNNNSNDNNISTEPDSYLCDDNLDNQLISNSTVVKTTKRRAVGKRVKGITS